MDRRYCYGFFLRISLLVWCFTHQTEGAPVTDSDKTDDLNMELAELDSDQDPLRIKFDGVDLSQDPVMDKEQDDCFGEYIQCAINSIHHEHICALDSYSYKLYKPERDFASMCDLDFQNCMIAEIYMLGQDPKKYPPHYEYEGEGTECKYSCKLINSKELNCVPIIIKRTTTTTTEPPTTTTEENA